MDSFVLSVLEERALGSFVGPFYGNGDEMGGPCVGIILGGVMNTS